MAHFENIVVDKDYRGKGYGKKIMNILIQKSMKKNCYKSSLTCKDNNIRFYKSCGFSLEGNTMSLI